MSTSSVTDSETVKVIERYVVLMYDRTSTCPSVNESRRIMYTRKNRAIENIPPTADALLQHSKRAALQAHVWQACLSVTMPTYDPTKWGWKVAEDGSYIPVWCLMPDISSHCTELMRCSCTTVCRNCKFRKNGLRCTKLCACDGLCFGQVSENSNPDDSAGECDLLWQEVEEDTEADNVLDILFTDTETF